MMNDKVVLVVGSTSGIGKAMAETFANAGAIAIVTGRREALGKEIAANIEAAGGKADFFTVDATNMDSCRALIDDVVAKYGKLDVLVYNAGIASTDNFKTTDEANWDRIMTTNLKAAFFTAQKALPELTKTKGNIIFTSSLAGISAKNAGGGVCYGASKAAMDHMVQILALGAGKDGVRVNAVAPGVTMTDILAACTEETLAYLKKNIPLGILGEPSDIANAALFLADDTARFITGQTLSIDGGASIS